MTVKKVFLYIAFATIATAVNLVLQAGILNIYVGWGALFVAMGGGTLGGLLVKFLLDRRWIFEYHSSGVVDGFWKFFLYSLFGVLTTFEFWLVEVLFDSLIREDWAKYFGGGIGLAIGYMMKYWLDRSFVFKVPERRILP